MDTDKTTSRTGAASLLAQTQPYLTNDLPGIGGAIKSIEEDFTVEEIPLYERSGEGTHVFFTIEKRGITTLEAIRRIARGLGVGEQAIGFAGLKDARGVARQTLSVEHVELQRCLDLEVSSVRVLSAARHPHKLRKGHLAGNRFRIRVRGCSGPVSAAQAVLDVLRTRGVPNFFGPQRFGARGNSAVIGRAALVGDYAEALAELLGRPRDVDHGGVRRARELFDAGEMEEASRAWPPAFQQERKLCRMLARGVKPTLRTWRTVNRRLRELYLSALQAALFNRVLAERIAGMDQLEAGDMAWIHRNGACFRVEDAAVEQPRCTALEISPTGPIYGVRMTQATGAPGEREARILSEAGVSIEVRRTPDGVRLDGARRPLRVPLGEATVEDGTDVAGPYIQLGFSLPAGAYATNVTREICKTREAEEP